MVMASTRPSIPGAVQSTGPGGGVSGVVVGAAVVVAPLGPESQGLLGINSGQEKQWTS